MLDPTIPIPAHRDPVAMRRGIPVTYVPARNTIFLSFALSCAEATGAEAIYVGAQVLDYSGYPDCRPAYFDAFRAVMARGTKRGVEGGGFVIETPLLEKTKREIVELGRTLGVPYELTWSCYQDGPQPCGVCDSCLFREAAFRALGMEDPALARVGVK